MCWQLAVNIFLILLQQFRESLKVTTFPFPLATSQHVDLNLKILCSTLSILLLMIEYSRFFSIILVIVYVFITVCLELPFFLFLELRIILVPRWFNTGPGGWLELDAAILKISAFQCYSLNKWPFKNCFENVVHLFIFLKEIYHCMFVQKAIIEDVHVLVVVGNFGLDFRPLCRQSWEYFSPWLSYEH